MKKFWILFTFLIIVFYVGLFSVYKLLNYSMRTCWRPSSVSSYVLLQEKDSMEKYVVNLNLFSASSQISDTSFASDTKISKTVREPSDFWKSSDKNTEVYTKEKNIFLKKGSEFEFFVVVEARCFGEEGEPYDIKEKDIKMTMNGQDFYQSYPIISSDLPQDLILETSWKNKFKNKWILNVQWLDNENFEQKKEEFAKQKEDESSVSSTLGKIELPIHKSLAEYGFSLDSTEDHRINIFKLDPAFYKAKISYNQNAAFISDWLDEKENTIVINGGYFNEDFTPSGYMMIDKKRIGNKKFDEDKSALLVIEKGSASIRDLKEKPLKENESFDFALQSYPFLIKNGIAALKTDSKKLARRSAIGIDFEKNLYLIVAESPDLSLYQFMNELVSSRIKFENVLNLDGGPSTGISVHLGEYKKIINSQLPVSNVLEFTFSK